MSVTNDNLPALIADAVSLINSGEDVANVLTLFYYLSFQMGMETMIEITKEKKYG